MTGLNIQNKFEYCHGNGAAYKVYKSIESKFTEEFKYLTFELLVELYIRNEMDTKFISDREFSYLDRTWRSVAEELNILDKYPYSLQSFPHAHPLSADASVEGKKRLSKELK